MNYGKIGGKILFLIAAGSMLGYTKKRQRIELLKDYDRVWLSIDRKKLFDALRALKLGGYVEVIQRSDGAMVAELTEKGRSRATRFPLDDLKLSKPERWDGKWRIVIFDIAEERRKTRNALRWRLKNLGFCELQRSVFVVPYQCEDEITILVNAFGLREEVRIIEGALSYDKDLRKKFKL